jgi:hypothetical protein
MPGKDPPFSAAPPPGLGVQAAPGLGRTVVSKKKGTQYFREDGLKWMNGDIQSDNETDDNALYCRASIRFIPDSLRNSVPLFETAVRPNPRPRAPRWPSRWLRRARGRRRGRTTQTRRK